ncbi:MAG TPA: hypothetical protein VLX68_05640 [Chitinivibrionales bacterium]|nr:hypothetical protein [Chitinivibrionales bacterium]
MNPLPHDDSPRPLPPVPPASGRNAPWFPLDNAARIYAAMLGSRSPTAFRVAAVLKEPVDPPALQKALDGTMALFPYFLVHLRYGVFWNYLQAARETAVVREERDPPCRDFGARRLLFRVLYYGKRISVEFSHVLTDGSGALEFARTLVAEYFRVLGVVFDYTDHLRRPGQEPAADEFEDAYERFFNKKIPHAQALGTAFHPAGELVPGGDLLVISGICSKTAILGESKKRNVSVTEFLTAHYLWALFRSRGRSRRDIRVMVPVNLRGLYPSHTMRNFFLTVFPGIRPALGAYEFDDILKAVHHYMQIEVDERFINQQIARNVASARNPMNRLIPLFVKLPILRMVFSHSGSRTASGILSNLGGVGFPEPVARHVDRFVFITSPNSVLKLSVGVIGFGERVTITFAGLVLSTTVPRLFFAALRWQGIRVFIETNKE